jgi:hypothetical protein
MSIMTGGFVDWGVGVHLNNNFRCKFPVSIITDGFIDFGVVVYVNNNF